MTRKEICDLGFENAICIDDFDKAIIGVSTEGSVVYSMSKMLDVLIERDGMTSEEANDYLRYNTIRSLPYSKLGLNTELPPPIIIEYEDL